MADGFAAFEDKWLARLRQDADVAFEYGPVPSGSLVHSDVADAFVAKLGLQPIGFNWELLDAAGEADSPRSALGEITHALANAISNPGETWLGSEAAEECAHDFLSAFDQPALTVVSNRYDGLWNPISGAAVEWGFVGFDTERAALLLIAQ